MRYFINNYLNINEGRHCFIVFFSTSPLMPTNSKNVVENY